MRRLTCVLVVCVAGLVSPACYAQQPNSPSASLLITGAAGPPYPITGVSAASGLPQVILVGSATANAPFAVVLAASLLPGPGVPVLGGQLLDVDLTSGAWLTVNGFVDPVWNTGPSAQFAASVAVPLGTPPGTQAALQAAVLDPANPPWNVTLTAATQVLVSPGLTIVELPTGNNGGLPFDFTPFGFTFSFYTATYTQMFVNGNGNITFTAASGAFAPTPLLFQTAQPRIAPMWTDLVFAPASSGSPSRILVTVDQSAPATPSVTVDWVDMAEWGFVGMRHSFRVRLDVSTGNIIVSHDPFNGPVVPQLTQFMGIGPGQNLLPPTGVFPPQVNLSALPTAPILGTVNGALWEWFGTAGNPFFPFPATNFWDMAGSTTQFVAIGAGTPSAQYQGM